MKKIGLCIQIGNYSIWHKIKDLIFNFDNLDYQIIIFLHFNSILIKKDDKDNIIDFYNKLNYKIHITQFINKGLDILGFFKQIEYIIKNNIHLDFILKLHTKSNNKWRMSLINPICGSSETILKCLGMLENEDVGQVSAERWSKLMDHFNTPIILGELKKFNIENNYIDEIDWEEKAKNIYDLDYFNPEFYLKYPYNGIFYEKSLESDKNKFNSYALFHWLQIGYDKFKFVPNPKLILKKTKHLRFSAGSIFWIDAKLLIDFFKKYINFNEYYENFEDGYFNNEIPTLTHTWERFFSIIVDISKKKSIVV